MRDLIFLYIGYGFIISEHPKTLISTWISSVVIYVILILNLVVSVDCNSFASIRLLLCSVQPYFRNTRLMKIENAMSVISTECYLQGVECNICCCFCIVCPWAVFILLHILFYAEQVFVPLYLCLQGCCVCTCISLLSNKISIFISKKNFINTTNCNLLASFGFVKRLMGS